jgi:hypothetical protein
MSTRFPLWASTAALTAWLGTGAVTRAGDPPAPGNGKAGHRLEIINGTTQAVYQIRSPGPRATTAAPAPTPTFSPGIYPDMVPLVDTRIAYESWSGLEPVYGAYGAYGAAPALGYAPYTPVTGIYADLVPVVDGRIAWQSWWNTWPYGYPYGAYGGWYPGSGYGYGYGYGSGYGWRYPLRYAAGAGPAPAGVAARGPTLATGRSQTAARLTTR